MTSILFVIAVSCLLISVG